MAIWSLILFALCRVRVGWWMGVSGVGCEWDTSNNSTARRPPGTHVPLLLPRVLLEPPLQLRGLPGHRRHRRRVVVRRRRPLLPKHGLAQARPAPAPSAIVRQVRAVAPATAPTAAATSRGRRRRVVARRARRRGPVPAPGALPRPSRERRNLGCIHRTRVEQGRRRQRSSPTSRVPSLPARPHRVTALRRRPPGGRTIVGHAPTAQSPTPGPSLGLSAANLHAGSPYVLRARRPNGCGACGWTPGARGCRVLRPRADPVVGPYRVCAIFRLKHAAGPRHYLCAMQPMLDGRLGRAAHK